MIALGMKPGKEIGETLNRLLDLVIEDPELNEKRIFRKESVGEIIRHFVQ